MLPILLVALGLAMAAGCRTADGAAAEKLRWAAPPGEANPNLVEVEFHPLIGPARGHIFYAVLAHSNGKVYAGACYSVARLVELDPKTGTLRVVARMTSHALYGGGPELENPTLLGDGGAGEFPATRWAHAQDKIHGCLHEGKDGRIYGGTHTKVEEPNATRTYPGGHWFAYDPQTEKVQDFGWVRRHEGIIACCMDTKRNVLYGLTWPTGYLVSCVPEEKYHARRLRILGMTASGIDCVSRYLDVVATGRVYMADGATGDILIYDPPANGAERGSLHRVPGMTTPASPGDGESVLRNTERWRNWWMTGARSPDGMRIFLTSQRSGHLTEIDATRGQWGTVIDHGRTVPWKSEGWGGPFCRMMVFGKDGLLYHTVGPHLLSFDPESGRVFDLGKTVLKSDPEAVVELAGGGSLGPDGRIYCAATYDGRWGIVALDLAQLRDRQPRLLRVSPRRVVYPSAAR